MFAADRDLLALEPNLFRDIAWSGQRLASGTAVIGSAVLKFTSLDVPLDASGIEPGFVVNIGQTSYEVVETISDSQLGISLLRPDVDGPVIPMADVGIATGSSITTFRPQIAIVHRQVMRMLGIEPDTTADEMLIDESSISNPNALRRVEALGALHLIYSAAGALTPASSATNARAELYRQRFAQERERIVVHLDLNGDGKPDVTRRLNVVQFVRL